MIRAIDVPWWGRPALAVALGALVGLIAGLAGRNASPELVLYAVLPLLVAGNLALGDLGRRRLSLPFTVVAAFGALALTACLSFYGAAIDAIVVGGLVAWRVVGAGKHRETRRSLLFIVGAIAGPGATIASFGLVKQTHPGEPLGIGLAAFHLLFWLPVAGTEAALAWSAARSVGPTPPV